MSIHPSLRGVNTLVGERSVFTRMERIQVLMRDGKFDPKANSVHGLPKVRTRIKAKKKVVVKDDAAIAAAAAATTAAPAAAPAAPAAPAKKADKKSEKKK
jgi:small basic protein (TIGR04137 family)